MNARSEALARGEKTYQGAPCKHWHSGVRYTIGGNCVPCVAAHRAAHKLRQQRPIAAPRSLAYSKRESEQRRYHANIERERERARQQYNANKGASRARSAKRRAMKLAQRCICCTDAEIRQHHDIAALCGPGAHVDHITPLVLGGHDCARNLKAMTAEDHIEKTRRDFALIAESRRRNRLLHGWRRAEP